MTDAPALNDTALQFASATQWAAWLRKHHAKSAGVWLRIAKKGGADTSVTYPEALEVALCFGWIDALKKNDGPQHWVQRFTPRSKRSIWSKVNREKALKLVELGRMQPAGQKEIERAQADGRWQAACDPQSASKVPPDLQGVRCPTRRAGLLRDAGFDEPLRRTVPPADRQARRHARAAHRDFRGDAGARREAPPLRARRPAKAQPLRARWISTSATASARSELPAIEGEVMKRPWIPSAGTPSIL